ncbi:hypothetical protein N0V94_007443 [Neodidymelliopsis sp. IMI 364377]|nr:hypothetical protein N0V94_007443 [Neodidymelliopsis sp. IMI 364377]
MATLNFVETCKKRGSNGRVALVEVGRSDERCGASRWTMAYLRLDKDLASDEDWKHEMKTVSKGESDQAYCEKLGPEAQKTALFVQDHRKGFFVTDDTIMQRFQPGWVYDTTDQEPEKAGLIHDLALKLGINAQETEKTVSEFNAACNEKPFDLMKLDGKATTGPSPNKLNWANPIQTAPFYGYPVTSHLTFTHAREKTNTDAQVLGTNDVPIPGLYATGEITGLLYNIE